MVRLNTKWKIQNNVAYCLYLLIIEKLWCWSLLLRVCVTFWSYSTRQVCGSGRVVGHISYFVRLGWIGSSLWVGTDSQLLCGTWNGSEQWRWVVAWWFIDASPFIDHQPRLRRRQTRWGGSTLRLLDHTETQLNLPCRCHAPSVVALPCLSVSRCHGRRQIPSAALHKCRRFGCRRYTSVPSSDLRLETLRYLVRKADLDELVGLGVYHAGCTWCLAGAWETA